MFHDIVGAGETYDIVGADQPDGAGLTYDIVGCDTPNSGMTYDIVGADGSGGPTFFDIVGTNGGGGGPTFFDIVGTDDGGGGPTFFDIVGDNGNGGGIGPTFFDIVGDDRALKGPYATMQKVVHATVPGYHPTPTQPVPVGPYRQTPGAPPQMSRPATLRVPYRPSMDPRAPQAPRMVRHPAYQGHGYGHPGFVPPNPIVPSSYDYQRVLPGQSATQYYPMPAQAPSLPPSPPPPAGPFGQPLFDPGAAARGAQCYVVKFFDRASRSWQVQRADTWEAAQQLVAYLRIGNTPNLIQILWGCGDPDDGRGLPHYR